MPVTHDFDLMGYYISNSVGRRFKDELVAGYTVPAKGVLLLFADAQPSEGSAAEPHLSFKLKHKKEGGVWLSDPNGYLIDSVEYSPIPNNDAGTTWTSYARFPDGTGEFQWCTEATPKQANGASCRGDVLY